MTVVPDAGPNRRISDGTISRVETVDDRPEGSVEREDLVEVSKREQVRLAETMTASREARVGAVVLSVPRTLRRLRFARSAVAADMVGARGGRLAVRVATITDAYSEAMLAGAFDVLQLHPIAWRRQIDRFEPEVLLVESAWTGGQGGWQYEISHRGRRRPDRLGPVLEHCKRRGVPTVFWNKEDPVGFVRFFPAARDFDVIATTDDRAAQWYRSMLPGADVVVVPFPLNPSIHHPVGERRLAHPDRVVFAGSWTNGDYPDREQSLEMMLDVAAERDALHIYTRRPQQFPERMRPYIQGALAPADVWQVSKLYAATLNVNSVIGSNTMLARRVVESLGSGVPVISTPTPAASNLFNDVVIEAGRPVEVECALDLVFDPALRSQRSSEGWRTAHAHHAVDDRFADVFARVGVDAPDRCAAAWTVFDDDVDRDAVRAATRFAGPAAVVLGAPDPTCDRVQRVTRPWNDGDVVARQSGPGVVDGSIGLRLDHVERSGNEA